MTVLNWILSFLKWTLFQQKMPLCHGHHYDVKCTRQNVIRVVIRFLWHDVIHWITATSYDKHEYYLYFSMDSSKASHSLSFFWLRTWAYLAQYSESPESSLSSRALILNWDCFPFSLSKVMTRMWKWKFSLREGSCQLIVRSKHHKDLKKFGDQEKLLYFLS